MSKNPWELALKNFFLTIKVDKISCWNMGVNFSTNLKYHNSVNYNRNEKD